MTELLKKSMNAGVVRLFGGELVGGGGGGDWVLFDIGDPQASFDATHRVP